MKIVILNGSAKGTKGATNIVVRKLKPFFGDDVQVVQLLQGQNIDEAFHAINQADGFVLVSPLYWNGLPFGVMQFLAEGQYRIDRNKPFVCVIQSDSTSKDVFAHTEQFMRQFQRRSRTKLLKFVGIQQGGALFTFAKVKPGIPPLGKMKHVFQDIVNCFQNNEDSSSVYFDFGLPDLIYQQMEKNRWKKAMEENGVKSSDSAKEDPVAHYL